MSATQFESDESWKEVFLDTQRRTTPARDYQPGWHLTGLGVALCVLALFALST